MANSVADNRPEGAANYAAVTPARDEITNLPRLFASLAAQTILPAAWIVIANGCTDGTVEYVESVAREHPWVHLAHSEPGDRYARTGRPYIAAVHTGIALLPVQPDVLVKLDADVSFDPDFFERILAAFADDDKLGIASGACWELRDGKWYRRKIYGEHVWGPTRSYRWPELQIVFPLEEDLGYARVDETKAHLAGWRTRTLHDLPFRHHRPEGTGDGSAAKAWRSEGAAAYYVGYRPLYVLAKTVYRMSKEPAAAAIVAGYLSARKENGPRFSDPVVRDAIRERQRVRTIIRRLYDPAGRTKV